MGSPSNVTFSIPFACYDGRYRTAYPQGDYPLPAPAGLSTPAVSSTTITAQLSSLPAWVQNVEWSIKRTSDSVWTVAGDQRTQTFTFTELDSGTAYQMRARFQYLTFYSSYSPVVAATTDTAGLPVAPTITGPTRINATTLRIGISGGSGADSWTAQYRTPSGSGSYQTDGPVTIGETSHNFVVVEGPEYDFRIVATNTSGSVNSNVVTGSSSTAGVIFFSDNFERPSLLPYSQNGAAYDGAKWVVLETDTPLIGSSSARFPYGPSPVNSGSTDTQLSMSRRTGGAGIGRSLTEFSLRYLMLLPTNWAHRLQPGPDVASNNKGIVQFWSGPYGAAASNQFIGFEFWPDAIFGVPGGGSILSFRWGNDGADNNEYGPPLTAYSSMFAPSDIGKRIQFRVYVKLASAPGMTDGIVRAWKWVEGSSPVLIFETTTWKYAMRGNYIDQYYILGEANSGFSEQTDILMDDINLMEGGLIGWGNFS